MDLQKEIIQEMEALLGRHSIADLVWFISTMNAAGTCSIQTLIVV